MAFSFLHHLSLEKASIFKKTSNVSIDTVAPDYCIIAKPEGLWQSPGTRFVSVLRNDRMYQEIATALWASQ